MEKKENTLFCARCGAKMTVNNNLVQPCSVCTNFVNILSRLQGFCSGLSEGVEVATERMINELADAEDIICDKNNG